MTGRDDCRFRGAPLWTGSRRIADATSARARDPVGVSVRPQHDAHCRALSGRTGAREGDRGDAFRQAVASPVDKTRPLPTLLINGHGAQHSAPPRGWSGGTGSYPQDAWRPRRADPRAPTGDRRRPPTYLCITGVIPGQRAVRGLMRGSGGEHVRSAQVPCTRTEEQGRRPSWVMRAAHGPHAACALNAPRSRRTPSLPVEREPRRQATPTVSVALVDNSVPRVGSVCSRDHSSLPAVAARGPRTGAGRQRRSPCGGTLWTARCPSTGSVGADALSRGSLWTARCPPTVRWYRCGSSAGGHRGPPRMVCVRPRPPWRRPRRRRTTMPTGELGTTAARPTSGFRALSAAPSTRL
jgi:hypothetical protein